MAASPQHLVESRSHLRRGPATCGGPLPPFRGRGEAWRVSRSSVIWTRYQIDNVLLRLRPKFEFCHLALRLGASGASRSRRDDDAIQRRVSWRRSNAEIGVPVAPPKGPGAFLDTPPWSVGQHGTRKILDVRWQRHLGEKRLASPAGNGKTRTKGLNPFTRTLNRRSGRVILAKLKTT